MGVAQQDRASDCGSDGREFESPHPPHTLFFLHDFAKEMCINKLLSAIAVSLLFFHGLTGCAQEGFDYDNILVIRVIDGDTIELQDKERVRLIGIDTPEARYNKKLQRDVSRTGKDYETIIAMGEKATKFTRSLLEGKRVRLEFDIEKRDRYGRLLAYVYLPDGRMLNAEIVKYGYGQIYTFPPNVKYVDLFLKLQREAREGNRGLWE